jgi:hypothetical protein
MRRRAIRPLPAVIIPRVFSGATPICTPQMRWMLRTLVTCSARSLPTGSRGEEVVFSSGQPVRCSRPFDFLVVADHAEGLGSTGEIKNGNPTLMADGTLRRWHDMMAAGGESASQAAIGIIRPIATGTAPKAMLSKLLTRSVWHDYTGIAERDNEPGRYTALIGYEWTSNNNGNNLHRVVIFRDGKDKADQIVPFSSFESEGPAVLWRFLDTYIEKSRGDVLAILHNGNLEEACDAKIWLRP